MTDNHFFLSKTRTILTSRRSALLASVASLGLVVLIAGPGGYQPISLRSSTAQAAEAPQQPKQASFADVVAKVRPAVISVRVEMDSPTKTAGLRESDEDNGTPFGQFFNQFGFGAVPDAPQRHETITGLGSGFFISPDGYAVTNNHVVDHAKSVQIRTDDGNSYTAKVVGVDPKTDLALIKVDGKSDFASVRFADHTPRVGDWVVAIGNPFGLGGTVTAGIVSARGRDIGSGPYDDYIQIDAPINKGNSGGPAFDVDGNVIGVNTAIYSPSGGSVGIGFDIPSDTAKLVVAQLKDRGSVTRGWLGVQVQPVTTEIADSLGMKQPEGALVDEPQSGSPAFKAGIQPGDVIVAINSTPVKDSRDLARKVGVMNPGSSINLEILRKGDTKALTLTLGQMPEEHLAAAGSQQGKSASGVPHLGLTLAPARDAAGAGGQGVVVVGVDPDSTAADHGLKSGDVILNVGGQTVTDAGDVRNALTKAAAEGKHNILMRVKTADATRFVALPISKG